MTAADALKELRTALDARYNGACQQLAEVESLFASMGSPDIEVKGKEVPPAAEVKAAPKPPRKKRVRHRSKKKLAAVAAKPVPTAPPAGA